MICSDSPLIAKVAVIVMIVSVVCSTIAIFSPWWNTTEVGGAKSYNGLIMTCQNDLSNCLNLQDLLDQYSNTEYWTSTVVTLSLSMVGWVFSIAALVVMIIYACLPNKITAIVSVILAFIAGALIIAAVIVYGVGFDDLVSSTLSYSFALDTAAGGLAIAAAVICYINTCLIP